MLLILVYHDSTAGIYETRKLQENKIFIVALEIVMIMMPISPE